MLFDKYGSEVEFLVVYTIEAHPLGTSNPYSQKEVPGKYSRDPGGAPIGQPATYEERALLAIKAGEEDGILATILVDSMDNVVWSTYGPAPNIAYLIGMDGTVLLRQPWYDPKAMESAIKALLSK